MEGYDSDLAQVKKLRDKKKEKEEKDFSKLINKKDLNPFEMDKMFMESD